MRQTTVLARRCHSEVSEVKPEKHVRQVRGEPAFGQALALATGSGRLASDRL
jgi:hypothetical protein